MELSHFWGEGLDGLVSLLGRGSELGSQFSASVVALELHFQSVFDVFLHHLCSFSQFLLLSLSASVLKPFGDSCQCQG